MRIHGILTNLIESSVFYLGSDKWGECEFDITETDAGISIYVHRGDELIRKIKLSCEGEIT